MSRGTKVTYTWSHWSTFLLKIMIVGMYFGRASGTQLDIMPDLNGLMLCGSSVVFTCTLQTVPPIAMTWLLNDTDAADCTATECEPPYRMPAHYTTTFISGTVSELRISPVILSDNFIIGCTDGNTDFIETSIKVGALPLTSSVNTQGDETNITVVSSCVFSPLSSVKFKIQNNNTGAALNLVNGNNVLTPTESVVCTDAENPNCGGSSTAKAKAVLTITTQATGTPTEISIVAVQSDEDLSPPQYIGSYILKGMPERKHPRIFVPRIFCSKRRQFKNTQTDVAPRSPSMSVLFPSQPDRTLTIIDDSTRAKVVDNQQHSVVKSQVKPRVKPIIAGELRDIFVNAGKKQNTEKTSGQIIKQVLSNGVNKAGSVILDPNYD